MERQLTREQLNFLTSVQAIDDWHCEAFQKVVQEHHFLAPSEQVVEGAIQFLSMLSIDQIVELQMALDIFGAIVGEIV
ncbi:hypothetical protein WA1_51535 [Scytonema hofmannii PCC 7110]|uniref:Uncharacterized protein n=1 Tax=Scytonema hofmannii PCC 7110 TaxID=128403 RepID=A0A139WPX5_9CYAN|nr:hypothetical protein [Scytonema hofmannii]KYC34478.1 hypothetical protein WA1_51535 [Scytonema hofmannii PCC 7110]